MEPSYPYSPYPQLTESQIFSFDGEYQYSDSYPTQAINIQTSPSNFNEDYDYHHLHSHSFNENTNYPNSSTDETIRSWEQLLGETSLSDQVYPDSSQSDYLSPKKDNFGFQQSHHDSYQFNQDLQPEEINSNDDYETIVRSKHLYYDPNPQIIRKPTMIKGPVIYNQNIMVRFLQPPPIEQGPLIIREIRPPQPPPLPPLVIRQRAPPVRSPSPIVLREKPPPVPANLAPQIVTKTLPPVPPPPRTVVVEKMPPLPPKPRDIIIERWMPYQSTQKRKIIVQRAPEPKPYPQPKNIIITYEPIKPRVVRRYEQAGVQPEDPRAYTALHGNSLLETQQLLAYIKELGINEDISLPQLLRNQQAPPSATQETNNQYYSASYDSLANGSVSSVHHVEPNEPRIVRDHHFFPVNDDDDQLARLIRHDVAPGVVPYQKRQNLSF